MTCNTIYETALALLGETGDSPGCTDYRSRSPHLLRIIVTRLAPVSRLVDGKEVTEASLTLESDFPLADKLLPCAAEMLASMLIFDELPELAKALMTAAEHDMKLVGSTTPTPDIGSAREVYGS